MIRPAGDTDDDLSVEEEENEDGTLVMREDPEFVLSTTKGTFLSSLDSLTILFITNQKNVRRLPSSLKIFLK